jgi:hypothetical protein
MAAGNQSYNSSICTMMYSGNRKGNLVLISREGLQQKKKSGIFDIAPVSQTRVLAQDFTLLELQYTCNNCR